MADEKANELLKELAGEAFDTTGGDRWRSGQPLAGDPTAAHAAEQKPPQETTPPPEPTSGEKLVLGKWKSEEEAQRGIAELARFATTQKSENEALKTKLDAVSAALSVLNGGKANGQSNQPIDPLDELEALAIPKEPVSKAIQASVRQQIEAMLKPVADRQAADKAVVEMYPDYEQEFDPMMKFLNENPEIKSEVEYAESQGQYLLARKYAWLNYERLGRADAQKRGEQRGKSRQERVAETLPDASIGSPNARSDSRTPPAQSDWPSDDRMKYLKDMAQAGHPDLLWRETLGRILKSQGFDTPSRY